MQNFTPGLNKRFPMFYLLISAISGILIGKYLFDYIEITFFLGLFFIFSAFFLVTKHRIALILTLLLLITSIFSFYFSYSDASEKCQQNIFPADKSILILARGYLLNEPQPRISGDSSLVIPSVSNQQANNFKSYKYSSPVSTFKFQVNSYSDGQNILDISEKIKVFADSIFPELPVGELIEIPLKIFTPYPPSNPGEFDFQSYERETGISRHGVYQCEQGFRKLETPFLHKISPWVWAAKIRSQITKKVMDLPPKQAAIFLTLTIGESESLSKQIKNEFKHTGTLHLLVISGLHIGFLIILCEIIFRILRISQKRKAVLIIVILLFFWILVGHKVSLSRAIVLAIIYYSSVLLKRPVNFPNLLSSAAFFVLLINPHELFHLGFYLSFSAVLFITYIGYRISQKSIEIPIDRFHVSFFRKISYKTKSYLKNAFQISLAGLISTAPIIWYSFGLITPGSIIMNILAIPLMFFTLSFSMVVLILESIIALINIALNFFNLEFLLSSVITSLSDLFMYFSGISIDLLLKIEKAVLNTPGCYFYLPPISITGMTLLILIFLCILFKSKLRISKKNLILASAIIFSFISYEIAWQTPENRNELVVTQFAFGQNSEVIVETPDNEVFLFTACKQDSGNSVTTMMKYLHSKRFKVISAIFITSAKATSLNNLIVLLTHFNVAKIIITPYFARSYLGKVLITYLKNSNTQILFASAGVAINQDKKVRFEFWAPQKNFGENCEQNIAAPQESVIAIRGVFGSIILTRDSSEFALDSQLDFINKNNIDKGNIPLCLMGKIPTKNKLFDFWLDTLKPRNIFQNSRYAQNNHEELNPYQDKLNLYDTSKSGALTFTDNFTDNSERITTFK